MTNKIKFEDLGLSEKILNAIQKKGFEEPSPIQALTIPVMLKDDRNMIAQAQTGTGKTAAFGLPLIEMIDSAKKHVQALILAPTRELAIQVSEEINSLKDSHNLKIIPVYGGQSIEQQLRSLRKGVHIVVGTPGRVIDHIHRKTLKLEKIEHLILDEADEMLNMGFLEDMEEIMKKSNPEKRTLLFSATMPERIKKLANKYMGKYELIAAKKQTLATNLTEQIYYEVKVRDKFEALSRIIDIEAEFYGIVFCRTKNDVDNVASHLAERGYDADAIHGDILQNQREKILRKFKKKETNVLVATDVAARGIDVNDLTHVINYSLPQDPEAYVHRIGRTGRAGKQGTAITFITPSEYKRLMFIQRIAKTNIKKSKVPHIKEIIQIKKNKINADLNELIEQKVNPTYLNWAEELIKENQPAEILSHLLSYCFDAELNPNSYQKIEEASNRNKNIEMDGTTRLFVAMGKKDNMNPRKLVDFLIKTTKTKNALINQVAVYNDFSFINVPFKEAERILKIFQKKSGKKKSLVVKARKK